MKKLWTVLITLVILSLTLGTIACGGGAKEQTGGDTSSSGSGGGASEPGGGGTSGGGSGGETCCWRFVGTLAPTMPPGQKYDWGGWIADAIDNPHLDVSYLHCPLKVDVIYMPGREDTNTLIEAIGNVTGVLPDPEEQAILAQYLDIDYLFQGQIIVNEQTGFVEEECREGYQGAQDCTGGHILGSFTFKLQLVDHHRGVVVKEGQTSWVGATQAIGGKFRGIGAGLDQIKELSRTFKPLPQIIHDYEGLPEKATLELEKDALGQEKDPIPAGEKMTIHLKDIVDYQGNTSQPWQWVIVKAEKGKIEIGNNGRDAGEGAVAFEVGGGAIDFIYKAPDECKKDTENKDTITVYNTCNNDPRTAGSFPREKVIATKSFDIDCTGWLLEFTYTATCPNGYGLTTDSRPPKYVNEMWVTRTYMAKVRAVLKPNTVERPPCVMYPVGTCQSYTCDHATVELQDDCSSKTHIYKYSSDRDILDSTDTGSWAMQYKGDLPLFISLGLIPDHDLSAKNGVPSYSFNIDFYADSEGGSDSAVPMQYQWTASHDLHSTGLGDSSCMESGPSSVTFIEFLPTLAFVDVIIDGLNTLVGEGGIPQEYTWSSTAANAGPWPPLGVMICDVPYPSFGPEFNVKPYTCDLKWTLTKLGE